MKRFNNLCRSIFLVLWTPIAFVAEVLLKIEPEWVPLRIHRLLFAAAWGRWPKEPKRSMVVQPQTLAALDAMFRAVRASFPTNLPASARRTKYMRLRRFLSRHFKRERINGGRRCPTYLYRWELLRVRDWALYLHEFVRDDWTTDLHDHPKRFISIGLWGRYCEETPKGKRVWRAPWIRTFPATHIHRLSLIDGQRCWTLIVVLKTVREWGFWHAGVWSRWKEYLRSKARRRDEELRIGVRLQ